MAPLFDLMTTAHARKHPRTLRCANGRVIIRVHGRYDVCCLFELSVSFPCNSVGGSGIPQGLVIPALPANHSQPLVASALALSRCDRNSYILTLPQQIFLPIKALTGKQR